MIDGVSLTIERDALERLSSEDLLTLATGARGLDTGLMLCTQSNSIRQSA